MDPSDAWSAKVAASRRTEALAEQLAPRMSPGHRAYLARLILRDAYPTCLPELLDLAVAYRENLDRLWLHDAAPAAERAQARATGPGFERALADLIARDART